MKSHGELALLLHTHMPYVEGFGTWPFGEEWLWEAMATSYLPLLDVLEKAPITLSLTPVLCDQLEAKGVSNRFERFLSEVRTQTHKLDSEELRNQGNIDHAEVVSQALEDYDFASERFQQLNNDLLGELRKYASWTSSATHAVLPLIATDWGVELQIQSGINSFRRHFGNWNGGFWLPECAYSSWLDPLLVDAGIKSTCLDLTDYFGYGSYKHLQPWKVANGLTIFPIDRLTMELPWSKNGYPIAAAYRDYHHTATYGSRAWANDGGQYDRDLALKVTREHAADFVAKTLRRLRMASESLQKPALITCAWDTELFGHWWYEGVHWLSAVVEESALQGLSLTTLDAALQNYEPQQAPIAGFPTSSWGTPRDLTTWDNPEVADFVWRMRTSELEIMRAEAEVPDDVIRELLALQASDWAFLTTRKLAGEYPNKRSIDHYGVLMEKLRDL